MTTTITRSYSGRTRFSSYDAETGKLVTGGLSSRYEDPTSTDRAEAEARLQTIYRDDDAHAAWDSYIITETQTTTITEATDLGLKTTVTTVELPYIEVERSAAGRAARIEASSQVNREYEASGEKALVEAWHAELDENKARKAKGEPEVKDAELAYFKFKGYYVPDDFLPQEPEKKSLLARIFN